MEEKIYDISLFGLYRMIVRNNDIQYIILNVPSVTKSIIMNTSEKSMKLVEVRNGQEIVEDITDNQIQKGKIKQLSTDGSRWEGDWYNKQSFGFGSIYDGEGNRIYSGFMFEGKKVGFGTEFFADTHTIDYCGNFMNDLRHGWGTTYDRNGQKLFEGDWRCGKNGDFEDERIVIEDNCEKDDLRIHNLIKELEIGEKCFNQREDDLVIENYPNLEKIVVKMIH